MAKEMTLNEAAKTINDRCAEMWKNPEVRKSVIKNIMAENPPVTEEKIKDYMFWAALYTLYYSVEERERLLAFTAGSLIVTAAGTAYIAGLIYVCGHTARGKRFARTYYDEITRLEKLLQTNNF